LDAIARAVAAADIGRRNQYSADQRLAKVRLDQRVQFTDDELVNLRGAGVTNNSPSMISYRWPSSGSASSISTVHSVRVTGIAIG
jgi:hypothetical protein